MKLLTLLLTSTTVLADFTKQGVYDVNVFETSMFHWPKTDRLVLLENIPCTYWGHAGKWDPVFEGHSYFRVRDFETGTIITNISSSIGMGFGSSFVDYDHNTAWVFGVPWDRCGNNTRPFGPPSNETGVWAYSSTDLLTWTRGKTNVNWSGPNVDVGRVYPPSPAGLPPHGYVMATEKGTTWAVNNGTDGDLTKNWITLDSAVYKGGVVACPSVRYLPSDGYYYTISGGTHIHIQRSKDLKTWEESKNLFIVPSVEDVKVPNVTNSKYNFDQEPTSWWSIGNQSKWDHDSNDADFCCESWGGAKDVKGSYVVWGVSDQGSKEWAYPQAFSGLGTSDLNLEQLLQSYF